MNANELTIHSFPPTAVQNQVRITNEKENYLISLHFLVRKGVLKMGLAGKVAGSGLNLGHLKKIFERDGEDGLPNTFSCKNCEGQPHVTNSKKTLVEIIQKLRFFFHLLERHMDIRSFFICCISMCHFLHLLIIEIKGSNDNLIVQIINILSI